MAVAGADGFDQFGDGLALVALGGVFGIEAEGGHGRADGGQVSYGCAYKLDHDVEMVLVKRLGGLMPVG